MYETIYNIMIYGGISLAVIFAIVAVIIFIKMDIPKVIGDLTGYTAKKQIKEIQKKGYESVRESRAYKKATIANKTHEHETDVLTGNKNRGKAESFVMLVDIVVVHTGESI